MKLKVAIKILILNEILIIKEKFIVKAHSVLAYTYMVQIRCLKCNLHLKF